MSLFRGKRVLIFGDSLSHPGRDDGPEIADYTAPVTSSAPGAVLAGKLLARGASATRTNARVSRSAVNFWSREDYGKLIASDRAWKPDVVLVMLGTNDLNVSPQADATAMAGIRDIYRQMGADVWAIGPPAFAVPSEQAKTNTVMATLHHVFGIDKVIDARLLTADLVAGAGRARDGVHFTPAGAELFAERLADVIASKSTGLTTIGGIGLGVALFFSAIFVGLVWSRR